MPEPPSPFAVVYTSKLNYQFKITVMPCVPVPSPVVLRCRGPVAPRSGAWTGGRRGSSAPAVWRAAPSSPRSHFPPPRPCFIHAAADWMCGSQTVGPPCGHKITEQGWLKPREVQSRERACATHGATAKMICQKKMRLVKMTVEQSVALFGFSFQSGAWLTSS